MSAQSQRDHVTMLAKTDPGKALIQARKIQEPWFRAQALAWVTRYNDADPVAIASEVTKAARECENDYQKSAVRAWEIAALAERDFKAEARKSLSEALALAKSVEPISSRSEALLLLLQAAMRIGRNEAMSAFEILKQSCPSDSHWRCKRAVRGGEKMISGEVEARSFFW